MSKISSVYFFYSKLIPIMNRPSSAQPDPATTHERNATYSIRDCKFEYDMEKTFKISASKFRID